jgi:hypothetical protein
VEIKYTDVWVCDEPILKYRHFGLHLPSQTGPVYFRIKYFLFLMSNFYCVVHVVCFLLGDSPASVVLNANISENCVFHLHRRVGMKCNWGWEFWGIYMGKGLALKIA